MPTSPLILIVPTIFSLLFGAVPAFCGVGYELLFLPQHPLLSDGVESFAAKTGITVGSTQLKSENVIPLLPDHVKAALRYPRIANTSNCFNSALRFHDPVLPLRYFSDDQFLAELATKYTRLKMGENLNRGDMIVVWRHQTSEKDISDQISRMKGTTLRHAEIYLGGDMVFQKPSSYPEDDSEITSFERSLQFYWVKPRPNVEGPHSLPADSSLVRPERPVVTFYRLLEKTFTQP